MVKLITRRHFAFFSHSRVQSPSGALFPCNLLAVVAILIYCGIEFFFPFQVKAELLGNSIYFRDRLFEPGIILSAPPLRNGIESFQFRENFVSECGSGLVKLFNLSVLPSSAFGELVVNDLHCKCTYDSTSSESDSWVKGYHANSLLLGFCIGGFLAIFVYDILPLILRLF